LLGIGHPHRRDGERGAHTDLVGGPACLHSAGEQVCHPRAARPVRDVGTVALEHHPTSHQRDG